MAVIDILIIGSAAFWLGLFVTKLSEVWYDAYPYHDPAEDTWNPPLDR